MSWTATVMQADYTHTHTHTHREKKRRSGCTCVCVCVHENEIAHWPNFELIYKIEKRQQQQQRKLLRPSCMHLLLFFHLLPTPLSFPERPHPIGEPEQSTFRAVAPLLWFQWGGGRMCWRRVRGDAGKVVEVFMQFSCSLVPTGSAVCPSLI